MVATTFEEAKCCPKCGKPGQEGQVITDPRTKDKVHTIWCRTELCRWFNTCWMVTVRKDGSIPAPQDHTGEPKLYSGFEGHDERAEELIASIKAMKEAQQQPGAELRSPYGPR